MYVIILTIVYINIIVKKWIARWWLIMVRKMRFKLLRPNKELFFNTLAIRKVVEYLDEIQWLVYSDLDVSFYREDNGKIIKISKNQMKVALERNWEMRGER